MSDVTLNLTPVLYEYYQKVSLREPEVLKNLRIQTQKMSTSQMQISPEQGQLMALLVELIEAKRTLDIGVFTGYSALAVALALPSDGCVLACDINGEWTKIAKRFWTEAKVDHKIDLRLAPAAETLQALCEAGQANTFDFAFIDANKKDYDVYYELALSLLRPGGLMAIDDVLFRGQVADPEIDTDLVKSLRALNQKILHDQRVSLSMLPVGNGLSLVRKR